MLFHKSIQKLINLDKITGENIFERNRCWSKIPDCLYKTLKIRGAGSEKTNKIIQKLFDQTNDEEKKKLIQLTKQNNIKQNNINTKSDVADNKYDEKESFLSIKKIKENTLKETKQIIRQITLNPEM